MAQGSKYAAEARNKLKQFGIDIHSAANGIWMDAKKHAPMHTKEYYEKINSFFKNVDTKAKAQEALKDAKDWIKSLTE